MESHPHHQEQFDAKQSLQVIQQMIALSQKKLKNDGILFIIWGWVSFLTYLSEYLLRTMVHTHPWTLAKRYITVALPVFALAYTVYYVYSHSRKAQSYIAISLRYVWLSMIACMVLINLIQANVMHRISFELQLPIFMVLVAFSLVTTGGILRYRMIIAGGIIFGLMAYLASFFPITTQLLIEAVSWLIAFVIPGHILHAKRNQ